MFAKRMFIAFLVFGALSITIFGLTAVAKFKPYGVPDALRDQWEAKQQAIAAAEANRKSQRAAANGEVLPYQASLRAPLARVPQAEHDFGLLDPGTTTQHTFRIENVGTAPLALVTAETSCKCTLSETSQEFVPPGEYGEVTLTWKTGTEREFYRQFAIVRTNDALHPEIELAVSGRVRTVLGFPSDRLSVPQLAPGEAVRESTLVFSQTLENFEITKVECDVEGFEATVYPAFSEDLLARGAKCGWKVDFSSAPRTDPGHFSHVLRVIAEAEGLDEPIIREIPLAGYVKPSISFYGSGLDARTGLDLGIINSVEDFEHRLYVRVRGVNAPQELIVSRVEPSILHAEVRPIETRPGMFQLVLTIPKGSEQTVFNLDEQHGYVEVSDKENPSNKNWFPVKGAVINMKKR